MKQFLILTLFCGFLTGGWIAGCGDDSGDQQQTCTTTCTGPDDETSCGVTFPASCNCHGTTVVVNFYGCTNQCCDAFEDLSLQEQCEAAQVLCD